MNILEDIRELGNKISNNINIKNMQEDFLKSDIGQIVNSAIDAGLKSILPDNVENEVIEVKDAFINGGIKEGINSAVENAIEIGKKYLGLENSEFKNINQVQETVVNGNLIGRISGSLDNVIDNISESNSVSENVINSVKNEKENIVKNIESDIDTEMSNQIKSFQKLEKYIGNWREAYSNKDITELNKQFKKIEKEKEKLIPLENILKEVREIENINELIENSENFDFNELYLDIAKNI